MKDLSKIRLFGSRIIYKSNFEYEFVGKMKVLILIVTLSPNGNIFYKRLESEFLRYKYLAAPLWIEKHF